MRALFAVAALILTGLANAATCYVTEFRGYSPVTYQAAQAPSLVDQAVTFTTSSVQSAAFNYYTTLVRVQCDVACWVIFGDNPTATTAKMKLAAGQTEYFAVTVNSNVKLAVIGT